MNVTGERLREAMADRGVSQAGLARTLGISQGSISAILFGKTRHSKHLADIAIELGVGYHWLLGEGDDKFANTPVEAVISTDEARIVENLRALPFPVRYALTSVMSDVFSHRLTPDVTPNLPEERALARMFEGLLRVMPPNLSLAEQALLLAQRLPIGLSQLRDLLPESAAPAPETETEPAEALSIPASQSRS